jgi:hypothetical protein
VVSFAIVASVALASCGTDPLSPRAARELSATYESLVAAVDAGDRGDARRLLRDLVASVDGLHADDQIDGEHAEAIMRAATSVSSALRLLPTPVAPATNSTSPYPSDPADPTDDEREDDEGPPPGDVESEGNDHDSPGNSEGKGEGKAKGHDKA